MSRRRGTAGIALPPGGYSRPVALSSDGLTLGPLVSEDGETIGPHDFHAARAPEGLVLPLVDALGRAAGPGGRWPSPRSVQAGAWILRRLAEEIAEQHPEVQSIGDVTPDIYRDWCRQSDEREAWPARINWSRALLQDTDGLPADTRRVVRTTRGIEPKRAAERAYGTRDFLRIRRAARRRADDAESRLRANREAHARYLAGLEPEDAPRVLLRGRSWSIGEILDHLDRTLRMPPAWAGASRKKQEFVRRALHLPDRASRYYQALFPSLADAYAIMLRIACVRGLNASSIARIRLSDLHRADDGRAGRPVYVVHLDKPRSGPRTRHRSVTFTGRAANVLAQAIFLTQGARDTLAALGYPTDQLLLAGAGNSTGHPTGLFCTDMLMTFRLSQAWQREEQILGNDGEPIEVRLRRVRKTWQGLMRRSAQNTQAVHERDYMRDDPRTQELARREVEDAQAQMLADARKVSGLRLSAEDLATARANPEFAARDLGLLPDQVGDLASGKLDTYGGTACRDIFHSPHPRDAGGLCTAPPVDCAGCPNSVSTPDHLPMQLAILRVLEARAAAVHGTMREGELDVYVLRYGNLVGRATTSELAEARSVITGDHIAGAERLVRGDFEA